MGNRKSNLMYVGFEDEIDQDIIKMYEDTASNNIVSVPTIKSKWIHTNGIKYKVVLITNLDSVNEKYPTTVVYKGKNGKVWSRPLSDWYRSFSKA